MNGGADRRSPAFALLIDYLIYGLLIPLTPYAPAHAAGEEALGLLYGAYAAGVLLATPLFGYLSDRIGYRRPMIYGAVLSAVALALSGFCPELRPLLLLGHWRGRLRRRAGPQVWR